MRPTLATKAVPIAAAACVWLLLLKYFWSLWRFPGVPFGYDAGIYRYLFQMRSQGVAWILPDQLPNWAQSHAPGLFAFTAPFISLGVPVDSLIGWVWNLMPVILACVLALVVRRKHGDIAALFTLVAALLSVVQYEGFLMMYYKVFVALLLCTFAFGAFDRGSMWWVVLGMLTIATHQQVALIFAVAVLSSVLSKKVIDRDPQFLTHLGLWVVTCLLGVLWYVPSYQRSLGDILPLLLKSSTFMALGAAVIAVAAFIILLQTMPSARRRWAWVLAALGVVLIFAALPVVTDAPEMVSRFLLQKSDATPGAFLSLTDYLRLSLPLLLLSVAGLILSSEKERGNPWQWAALWCAVAAFGMFFFYRRFLLPMDFFLLPFAGLACAALWKMGTLGRVIVGLFILVQGGLMLKHMSVIDPHVEPAWLLEFARLEEHVPLTKQVVVLDNMAPWVVGYLPENSVSGPGIFDSFPFPDWEKFLLGNTADRQAFFDKYPKGTFFYASPVFYSYYPPEVADVLKHPCLYATPTAGLFASACGL